MDLAQKMVLGTEYYERKEIIRTKLKQSLEALDRKMTTTRQSTTADLNTELTIVRAAIIVLTLAILGLIAVTIVMGTQPLVNAEEHSNKGEPIPETGVKEFRKLAKGYNKMHEKLYGTKEEDP